MIARFASAPSIEEKKKTREGENRSATDNNANTSVPEINPSCTAEVIFAVAFFPSSNATVNSGSTAFPANHNDVPANCERMISGSIFDGVPVCNGIV